MMHQRWRLKDKYLSLLLITAVLLISQFAQGQVLQKINTYGVQYKRFLVDSSLGIPQDTLAPPLGYNNNSWIAAKDGVLWVWSPVAQQWVLGSSGSAFIADTNFYSTRSWRQKGIDSVISVTQAKLPIGTTSQYWDATGALRTFSTSVTAVTNPLYSQLGHGHTASQISDFTVAVRSRFTAGTGISIIDGTISATGGSGSGANNYTTAIDFDTTTGVFTLDRDGLSSLTKNIDGRYLTHDDTSSMLSPYQHWLAGYATNSALGLKLNLSDTSSMLTNYRHWLAGYLKSADIAGKLNISDTASMLSPYLRSGVAAATYQPIGSYELLSNKATTFGTLNNTLYPTTQAVSNYVTGLGYSTFTQVQADARYPLLSGTYNNPTWLNQLAWGKITGTPTTLAGYGITDAQGTITLTTTGTTGAATLTGNTLNIPNYSTGGSMVYPGAGIPVSTGSAWGTSLDATTFVRTTGAQTIAGEKAFTNNLSTGGTFSAGGNITNSAGSIEAINGDVHAGGQISTLTGSNGVGRLRLYGGNQFTFLQGGYDASVTTDNVVNLPLANNATLAVSVNGQTADAFGNITISTGSGGISQTTLNDSTAAIRSTFVTGYTSVAAVDDTSYRLIRFDGTSDTVEISLANGDKGDITVHGGWNNWTIDNGAVTDAKIASVSAAKITGELPQSQVTNLTNDLAGKQSTLVSGTNIKTINGTSLLGSGNISISSGGGGSFAFNELRFKWGVTTNAPAAGTATLIHDSLVGKELDVFREGELLLLDEDYTFNNSTGTITYTVPQLSGEKNIVKIYASGSRTDVALQASGGTGSGAWENLSLDVTSGTNPNTSAAYSLEVGANYYQGEVGTAAAWGHLGKITSKKLAAGQDGCLALIMPTVMGEWSEFSMVVSSSVGQNWKNTAPIGFRFQVTSVFSIVNGTEDPTTINTGFANAANERIAIWRRGTTLTIEKSTDAEATWTVLHTFSGEDANLKTGDIYYTIDFRHGGTIIHRPLRGYNLSN